MSFNFELLPDHVFVKIMNDLCINDIQNFCESGLDGRIEMAFENMKHAVVVLQDCYPSSDDSRDLNIGFLNYRRESNR